MTLTHSPKLGVALSLLIGLGAFAYVATPELAYAQDRDTRAERRTIKLDEVDAASRQSEEYEKKAEEARLSAITKLKELIANFTGGADQKAEMILRLADLYFEQGRYLYLKEMDQHGKCYDAEFNKAGGKPEEVCKVADFTKGSREWQERSIKLYKQILTSYPQFPRADEATFFLASALGDVGRSTLDTKRVDESNTEFTRLVRSYSSSAYAPDAYVQIGEYFFDKNEAPKALSAYKKAAQYKDHPKYAFANYKLAWCYYNVGENNLAIDTLKLVVDHSMADTSGSKSNLQLQEEALKDLVRFFADAGELDEAYEYFNKLGKKELIRDALKRLASTYFENGKFEDAVTTYRRLISEQPDGPNSPEYQDDIIQAYRKMGRKQETIDEIDRLLKNYGKQSQWARTNATNQDAIKSANERLEKNLRSVASEYHNEAKKLKTGKGAESAYKFAEQAYETYLTEFETSKYSYDVRYGYSELLYTVKKHDKAYEQYMKVVSIDPKGQHSRFCAESAIFAAEEMLKREGAGQTAKDTKSTARLELTDWEKKQLEALDQYSKLFPEDGKTRNVIYKSAYLLYNKNQFKEASERFNIVIAKDPKSREAEQAANLILDSFALVEDWDSLKTNSKLYFDQQGLGSSDFKKEVYGVYENASLKLIEVSFKKGQDKSKGAADYLAFYKEFPSSANADLALNNASVYLRELGRVSEAIPARLELINKFPKSKFYKDQVANLGFDYESLADFANAAVWYEKLFRLDPQHSGAPDALFSAAYFRRSLGEWETAIANYKAYIDTYKDKPNLTGLKLEIAKIYEEKGKFAEASGAYLAFFTPPTGKAAVGYVAPAMDEQMFARLRYGLLLEKLGQGAKQMQFWKDTLAFFEKARAANVPMENSVEYAAQIMLLVAEPQYQAFLAMKIDGPGSKSLPQKQIDKLLKEQLLAKAKAMGELDKTFTAIIQTGAGEFGLAALTRLGSAYENMRQTLLDSYVPAYLTEDQKELYRYALEDRAYPQEEKAIAAYSAALAKSYELNLYNDNTANATRRLGVLRPNEFPGLFETVPQPRYAAPSVETSSFETAP